MTHWLGIDFGTSNSAAAYVADGTIHRVRLSGDHDTMPTAVFFDFDQQRMTIGHTAHAAMLDGRDGRYMRSLKRVLGTALMGERRMIVGRHWDFHDIVSEVLLSLKHAAEAQAGRSFDRVVAGRPVLFDSKDPAKNARAAEDLERCYRMAGFREIVFLPEPEAAAHSITEALPQDAPGLVVDIGGGTSDFTLFARRGDGIEVIASGGVRIGGTDFDRALNLRFIQPELGYRHKVRVAMSRETITAPVGVFHDLATWEKIPFLYTQATRTLVRSLVRDGLEPDRFRRLLHIIDEELGHDVALLAEHTKIAANSTDATTPVDLRLIEPGLSIDVDPSGLHQMAEPIGAELVAAMDATLMQAQMPRDAVRHIVPVGGSSLLRPVRDAFARTLPEATLVDAPIFTAIVDGLALYGQGLDGSGR